MGSLALIATVPLTACGDPSVSPRPTEAATAGRLPGTTPPGATVRALPSVSAIAGRPVPRRPVPTRTAAPVRTGPRTAAPVAPAAPAAPAAPTSAPGSASAEPADACYGAVRHDLDLRTTVLELVTSMCFHAGGVLRLQGIGPGLVTATPESLVAQNYEAGVVDLRFLRPGTVTVTIPQDERTDTITVVVVR